MPWRETSAMEERLRFVQDVHRPGWSIAELCRRYEVSRKTGYKWLRAYERGGPAALADGSHLPHTSPQVTALRIVRLILDLQRRYTWGARKVRRLLLARVPADQVPTKTTIHRILERHGRVRPRRRSPRRMHPGPGHYERRLVSRNGGVRWKNRWVNASHLFAALELGFEEIDDGLWNVYFGPVWLGRFHEAVGRIVDQLGRPIRRTGGNHK